MKSEDSVDDSVRRSNGSLRSATGSLSPDAQRPLSRWR